MRWVFVPLLCLLLGACFSAGKRGSDPIAIYDFGPPRGTLLKMPRATKVALEVNAPLWFDTMGIDYRLAYLDPARLREYAHARWAGPPAQLIQQRLMQRLDYGVSGQGRSYCLLRVELTEFSQIFSSPESSRGMLQGRVILLDHARQVVADRVLNLQNPASTPDSRGGVDALSATVDQLADSLLAWEQALKQQGNVGGCFS